MKKFCPKNRNFVKTIYFFISCFTILHVNELIKNNSERKPRKYIQTNITAVIKIYLMEQNSNNSILITQTVIHKCNYFLLCFFKKYFVFFEKTLPKYNVINQSCCNFSLSPLKNFRSI